MTLQDAQKLIEQVQREEPRIVASLESNRKDTRGYGYQVRLELKTQKLVMHINYVDEWETVKWAWSHWLPGLEVEQVRTEPRKRVYYLVDGIPMCFYQDKKYGHWLGSYRQNGQSYKRYFGKTDPRERYPIVKHSNERQETAV